MQDNLEYYKRLSNPMCTLSKTQKGMLGHFKSDVSRQAQSRQTRLRILAAKRSRVHTPDASEHSDPSDRSGPSERSDPFDPSDQSDHSFDGHSSRGSNHSTPPYSPFTLPFPVPAPVPAPVYTDTHAERRMYEDDLDSRMQDLGIKKNTDDESIRTQELRYWRKKVSLEEEAAVKQAGMLLSLLSSFVESFTNAIGFTVVRTQGLSEAIQTALEAGDFDLAIKSYCVSPQALNMLKNPVTSFMTSFGHVLLRTHIENVKRELKEGIDRFNPKQTTVPHRPTRARVPPSATEQRPTKVVADHLSTPWDTRHVVDTTGNTRPIFKVDTKATPCIADSFRTQVSSMGPMLNVITQLASASSAPTPTGEEYTPAGLSLS